MTEAKNVAKELQKSFEDHKYLRYRFYILGWTYKSSMHLSNSCMKNGEKEINDFIKP